MTVLCPASFAELRSMLRTALYRCGGPVAVRYPRGGEGTYRDNCGDAPVSVLRQGADVSIVTYGILTEQALAAAALLLERGAAPEKLRLLNAGERLPAQGSVRQLYHALGLDAQGVVCAVKEVLA